MSDIDYRDKYIQTLLDLLPNLRGMDLQRTMLRLERILTPPIENKLRSISTTMTELGATTLMEDGSIKVDLRMPPTDKQRESFDNEEKENYPRFGYLTKCIIQVLKETNKPMSVEEIMKHIASDYEDMLNPGDLTKTKVQTNLYNLIRRDKSIRKITRGQFAFID